MKNESIRLVLAGLLEAMRAASKHSEMVMTIEPCTGVIVFGARMPDKKGWIIVSSEDWWAAWFEFRNQFSAWYTNQSL